MPKLIVLFFGAETPAAALAEAAAEGATRVRFTEVDLRAAAVHQASSPARHKLLGSPNQVRNYDGIILACPGAAEMPMELSQMLEEMESEAADAFADTVFGVAGAESTDILGRVARLGGLIATAPHGIDDPEARARALGARVATVVGWVRHALSHEHH